MSRFTESEVEDAALNRLVSLGYEEQASVLTELWATA